MEQLKQSYKEILFLNKHRFSNKIQVMKPTVFTLLFSLLILLVLLNFKLPEKLFVPPETVQVNETLFFDKAEVSNAEWRKFDQWVKEKYGASSFRYWSATPDTTVWRKDLAICEEEVKHYNHHPKYSDHPVVGISYEQAVRYCNWRTEKVMEMIEQGKMGKKSLPKSLNYRLPTKTEWEQVAKAGYSDRFQQYIDKKGLKRNNLHNIVSDSIPPPEYQPKPNPDATITAPVISYFPNKYGIFNLIGNVAEMTSAQGIAKGGSWRDRSKNVTVEKDFTYDGPAAWLGFRCVCEVNWD